jgi:hypothetical protein
MDFLKKYFYAATGISVFIIYLFTLAPSVVQIDSGELAAVQAVLGIAHPTGYPLFTIVGYIFSLIPLPFTKIFQLNLLAAIYCSAGISVFVYSAKLVLDNINITSNVKSVSKQKQIKDKKKVKSKTEQPEIYDNIKYFAAIGGGLILAFSETYWMQSTSVEVYSLHLLLINLIILFMLKAFLYNRHKGASLVNKSYLIFAAFLALGFSNHMTTILIIPGAAVLYFSMNKITSVSIKQIVIMLAVFFPVLIIIYLYLPLRASQDPVLNWGNPTDFERLLRHITGKQYQVWLFESTTAAKRQFIHFVQTMPGQFSISLLLSFIGIFVSFIYARKFSIFLLISFVFTVLYSINYDIQDIDSYFLLAYISLGFFSVFGLLKIFQLLEKKILIPSLIVVLIIGLQFFININKTDQSGVYTYEDYSKAVLNSTTRGSIIFSYQWDFFISSSYYFRFVEDFRKDVAVVDKELLRRSWYFDQLDANYPYLLENMQDDVKEFKDALLSFERSEAYNANLLEQLYRKIMAELVVNNIDEHDFYVAPEVYQNEFQRGEFKLPEGYKLVPDNLLYKVVKKDEYSPSSNPDFQLRISDKRNYYIDKIEYFSGLLLSARAMYELQNGREDRAKMYVKKIRNDLPNYQLPFTIREMKTD